MAMQWHYPVIKVSATIMGRIETDDIGTTFGTWASIQQ
jgi:hypothetical protein